MPTAEHVAHRRLAFASAKSLVYPESAADASRLAVERTAILQRLEQMDRVLATLAEELMRGTNTVVSVSAYLSAPGAGRFSWHIDMWESALIQLSGRKVFELRQGTNETMVPGDLLYLPRGLEHRTRTVDASIHLSIVALAGNVADGQ